jgi:hypothetical protein
MFEKAKRLELVMGLEKLVKDWTGLKGMKVFKKCKECVVHRTKTNVLGKAKKSYGEGNKMREKKRPKVI